MQKHLSFWLKSGVVVCALTGVLLCVAHVGQAATDGITSLLYFTQQSNLWICIITLALLVCGILEETKGVEARRPWLYVARLAFTVSITLTGFVFCFVLAPASGGAYSPWTPANFLTHVLTPLLAVADFFVDGYMVKFTKKQAVFSLAPPLGYFVFALIAYHAKIDFGGGNYYPYFFLNIGSPAGWFGLGGEMPYFMGTFYWVVVILTVVLGLSYFYVWLYNKLQKRTTY